MEDGFVKNGTDREEIFSKAVRAGKRTYFFDVKSTKANEYYLTITESKKRFGEDGKFFYEKHKLFLYKEDFDKFTEGLSEAISHIKIHSPIVNTNGNGNGSNGHVEEVLSANGNSYADVKFEDLGAK